MKKNLLRISMVAVLAATAAFAQNSTSLRADVPFDFIAGKQAFPAGQYTVNRGPVSGGLTIRCTDGKSAAILMALAASSVRNRDVGALVFHRYGDKYFLSEIWNPGKTGQRLMPTKQEREVAAKTSAPGNTTIAAAR